MAYRYDIRAVPHGQSLSADKPCHTFGWCRAVCRSSSPKWRQSLSVDNVGRGPTMTGRVQGEALRWKPLVPYVVNTNSARQVEFTERESSHTVVESTQRPSKPPR